MLKRLLVPPLLAAMVMAANAQDARNSGPATTGSLPPGPAVAATVPGATPAPRIAVVARAPIPAKAQFGFILEPTRAAAAPIGSYARGCLAGAVALPTTGPAWQVMRLSRNRNWGHPELVAYIERFATDMRAHEGWTGLLVGDMSQPRGGPMITGHASHQIGLDVDFWFKPMPAKVLAPLARETIEATQLALPDATHVLADRWNEGWVRLLRRAASYPEVARIFVHPAIKKELCEAAQYDRRWMTKVRAYFGHNDHFHVRLRCPPGSKTCVPQADPTPTDGCGMELAYWLKVVSRPPPPSPPVASAAAGKPVPPAAPAASAKPRFLTLADLPADCSGVLADGKPALLASVAPGAGDLPMPQPSPARAALALRR